MKAQARVKQLATTIKREKIEKQANSLRECLGKHVKQKGCNQQNIGLKMERKMQKK